jgi:hypothetical protein
MKLASPRLSLWTVSAGPRAALVLPLAGCAQGDAPGDGDLAGTIERAIERAPAGLTATGEQLVAGRAHGCSLDPAISGLLCWGDNRRGQTNTPRLLHPTFVAAGGDVTCAVDGGRVRCWGDRTHDQLSVPSGVGRAVQVAVGGAHVCALNDADQVRCWGDDAYGQLSVPTALRGVRALAAGARHTCALTADGVRCWGDNGSGQLDVPALQRPSRLAVGAQHGCVIDGDEVICWGGTIDALLDQVPDVHGPSAIAAGAAHTCVVSEAGTQCWGDTSATDLTPRELTLPVQLAVGGGDGRAHACARHLQGVTCWGDDSLGQLRYDGRPLHVLYRAEALIDAAPARVFDVLLDLDGYGAWNPYTIAMKSSLRVGDPMVMTVRMNALLTLEQTEYIRVLDYDGYKICWGIETTTPELNSGERCQWLEPQPDGRTRYVTEDLIEGSLNPLVSGLFDRDLQLGFEGVARGLERRAESP